MNEDIVAARAAAQIEQLHALGATHMMVADTVLQ